MIRISVLLLLIAPLVSGIAATSSVIAAEPSDYLSRGTGHPLFTGDMPAGVIAATRQAVS